MSEEIKETFEINELFNEWKTFLSWCYENNDKTVEIHRDKIEYVMNYIINLQNENEELKGRYDLVCKISEERKNKWLNLNDENEEIFYVMKDYKSRNEKAIKWLENHIKMINGLAGNNDGLKASIVLSDDIVVNSLLYILQGGDE